MKGPAAALRELSARMLASTSSDEVVQALVAAVRDSLGADRVHIAEISQDAAIGHTVAIGFESGEPRQDQYVQVLDDRPSGVARVVETGRPYAVPDARSAPELRPDYVTRFDVASAYFLPLTWAGEVRYVAVLVMHAPRTLDEDEGKPPRASAGSHPPT